ncbi:ribose transport system ATP-binding protein [Nocardioides sp. J9]|uniref:sugar ABC transporter ATP-binding protein n=1 Tax=unclassified Nocardioides TaxID=2615069 RepID=UPI000688ED1C|nr:MULTISPECIES: sugar ABC transporter ATP-binding protein [unclassified Nocardioides]TWH02675.1 ribose transport system ATP-binding protein [Nocardioides sp. J9]
MHDLAVREPGHASDAPVTHGVSLAMEGISKRFGGAVALEDASVRLRPGTVLGLCGANGAGKSTLVRILAGVEQADSGRILLDGREVRIDSPRAATALGLSFVHQELNLVPKFTGVQNLALGHSASRLGLVDERRVRARAAEVADMLGHPLVLDVPVDRLPVAERWMLSLARGLMRPAKVVALDEPTASFTEEEAERLYAVIEQLTGNGVGLLYISHRLEEVLRVTDDICVLRNGRLVGTFESDTLDVHTLTRHIAGREVESIESQGPTHPPGERVRLAVRGLSRAPLVNGIDLDLHEGEVLGIAGLVGSGRTELARLLIGADAATSGTVVLDGEPYAVRSPHEAIRRGICLVPEERRSQGLVLSDSIEDNLQMAELGAARRGAALFRPRSARRVSRSLIKRFGVKARSSRDPVHSLSGGNQQKVVLGKYVRTEPRVLILDEPTVGVDVGARADIYRIIGDLAASGCSVLVISSDFDELAICHRVVVVRAGTVVASVERTAATKNRLTELCFTPIDEQETS